MSFQIFLLVGHFTNWTGHNLLTDNTLKKITQEVLVRFSVIVSNHNAKMARHFQNLVEQCPVTDCYFQHWYWLQFQAQQFGISPVESELFTTILQLFFPALWS